MHAQRPTRSPCTPNDLHARPARQRSPCNARPTTSMHAQLAKGHHAMHAQRPPCTPSSPKVTMQSMLGLNNVGGLDMALGEVGVSAGQRGMGLGEVGVSAWPCMHATWVDVRGITRGAGGIGSPEQLQVERIVWLPILHGPTLDAGVHGDLSSWSSGLLGDLQGRWECMATLDSLTILSPPWRPSSPSSPPPVVTVRLTSLPLTQVCNGAPGDDNAYADEEKKDPAPLPGMNNCNENYMHACCKKDQKLEGRSMGSQYMAKQNGDLSFMYDVLKSYEGSYEAQVTMDSNSPLGKLDRWNLTWEWMRGEFIYSMKGAYTPRMDHSECIHGPAAKYLQNFDFSQVMNCDKTPTITDLPLSKANDTGLEVLHPPQKWNITGYLNARYKCGAPIRVDPTEFPEPSGLDAKIYSVASWQVVCNITKPDPDKSKCCVSFTAYYSDSAIPCPTCACGCDDDYIDTHKCNPDRLPLLLPPNALLLPAENRTEKAREFSEMKNKKVPHKLPCPDNCGVSINWHLNSDDKARWTARMTLFNWGKLPFIAWFVAIESEIAYEGFNEVYSFNGTNKLKNVKNTIFFHGLKGLEYLLAEKNGDIPDDPRIPGKQQSEISFTKKDTPNIAVREGDGFPLKVYFNGEECILPDRFPSSCHRSRFSISTFIFISITTLLLNC
ncbi:COBRA-like protein 10 [Hibiscus syriacus]|uniref:COBRA-like protein 10 n=1 Tax=Hibiscus syriacus TaxID=106335 RepID=A0A6A2W9Y5_HIBSY|nr:COBRA-like protein 10 [Hibiscus syriacus]